MSRKCVAAVLIALTLATSGILFGDDKKETPKVSKKLPAGFNKLGLSESQRQKIQQAMADYGAKVEALQKQIIELRERERAEISNIRTDEQKTLSRDLLARKVIGEPKEKKSGEKSAPDKK
jgi:hypothetical protein